MLDPVASGSTLHPMSTRVDYRTDPSIYKHWKLDVQGPIATLTMDVKEDGGIREGYTLKLNSYDLGVDIELADAVNRVRFEHPGVKTVVMTSGKDRIFCSGANIFMLGTSTHAWKVNFCKFTNETRNGLEDTSRDGGIKFLAAVNGVCAGGGYELALACDEIYLIDDRSSAVSLPEVPLLGVLPGTGGLTRVTDKRRVRRDRADIFCTVVEGIRGEKAKEWKLVDEVVKPQKFEETIAKRANELAAKSNRPDGAKGVALPKIERQESDTALQYRWVDVVLDRAKRNATITVKAPASTDSAPATDIAGIEAAGATWWPLAMARDLDDAILSLRTNELDLGTWILKTSGSREHLLAVDAALTAHKEHWFVRETVGFLRRTIGRLDVSSRSLFALVEAESAFAGVLAEIAFAADRTYMASLPDAGEKEPRLVLTASNFGLFPMVGGGSRLSHRFYGDAAELGALPKNEPIAPAQADKLGLVTSAPDDLDWADEIRIALEERAAMSPDALTGLEANLRFGGPENLDTRVFGRLSAWQNWIFIRPNAVGERGALKVYGKGEKAQFDTTRV